MNTSKGTKRSVYLTEQILKELLEEAERQDRSVSWLLQRAWILSKDKIKKQYSGD
jgi:uncharacterized small protein (TIGR04563 family)